MDKISEAGVGLGSNIVASFPRSSVGMQTRVLQDLHIYRGAWSRAA